MAEGKGLVTIGEEGSGCFDRLTSGAKQLRYAELNHRAVQVRMI